MNLARIAVTRPVFTLVITATLFVLGVIGYRGLSTDLYPDVSFPVVSVVVPYPGASPEAAEREVARVLEDALAGLRDLDTLRTDSRDGLATVIATFKLGRNDREAEADVRSRVSEVRGKLPPRVKEPIIARYDAGAAPVMLLALSGGSPESLRRLADETVRPRLERLKGVAKVDVRGGDEPTVEIELDPTRLGALGISRDEVAARIAAGVAEVPVGRLPGADRELSLRVLREADLARDLRDLVVRATPQGGTLAVRDLGEVRETRNERTPLALVDGQPAVTLTVKKQGGSSTVDAAVALRAEMAALRRELPPGVAIGVIADQAVYVEENLAHVKTDLWVGGGMAILVILFFMRDLRSTLISAVALPTSVVATFFVLWMLGYTLNMMTLLALSLAIGLLIDDAIVVRENITKHLERGVPPLSAAVLGTEEIALSVLATTLTLVAVFLPVAFVKGTIGQFFRSFGVTVSAAVVVSLFVAFTVDPMLSSRFSKAHVVGEHVAEGRLSAWVGRLLGAVDATYARGLRFTVAHPWKIAGLTVALLAGTLALAARIPGEFLSAEDRAELAAEIRLAPGTSRAVRERLAREATAALRKDPQVRTVVATAGDEADEDLLALRVLVVNKLQRPGRSLYAIKQDVRQKLRGVFPGHRLAVLDPPAMDGSGSETPVAVGVRGGTATDDAANVVAAALAGMEGVADVVLRRADRTSELRVEVDGARAATLGRDAQAVGLSLRGAVAADEIGRLRDGSREVPIFVRWPADRRGDRFGLLTASLGNAQAASMATLGLGDAPGSLERENRERQVRLGATLTGTKTAPEIAEALQARFGTGLPGGARLVFDGDVKYQQETNDSMSGAMLLGVVFVYLVLAAQFESLLHPVAILVTMPLALVGGIGALAITGKTISLSAMIGMILLLGLVTKNAILLVDRAIVRVREQGEDPRDAIVEAGPERLRPILMTSAAMVLGMLPTALANGEGSEFRSPMGVVVIGGVISSTFLSLFVVPIVYLALERVKALGARFWPGAKASAVAAAAVLAVSIVLAPQRALADEPFTRQAVRERAAQRSPQVRAAEEDVAQADARVKRAQTGWLPSTSLAARYTRLSRISQPSFGGSFDGRTVVTTAPEGPLAPGAPLIGVQAPSFAFPILLDQYVLSATVTVPVSDLVLRTSRVVAAATRGRDAADAIRQAEVRKQRAQADLAFVQLERAIQNRDVVVAQVETAKAHEKETEARARAGLLNGADVTRASSERARSEALVARANAAITSAEAALRRVGDLPADATFVIEPLAGTDEGAAPALRDAIDRAVARRPDVRAAGLSAEAAEAAATASRRAALPRLDVQLGAQYANPNPRIIIQQPTFRGSWDASISLTISPDAVLRELAGADEEAARARKAREDQRVLVLAIREELEQAIAEQNAARAAAQAAAAAESSAKASLDEREALFRAGRATALELADARAELLRTRLERTSAQAEVRLTGIRLRYALGD